MPKFENEKQRLFYEVLRIRMVETEISRRYSEQQMRCPVHLSIGQEGAAVGMASVLNREDYMVSTHRGHAHYLAKGGALKGLISELYGKQTGCAKGQGGSMHLIDLSAGFLASTSIVGGTIPIGVGAAFSSFLTEKKNVTVVCIGDAAVEEGVFHESANFAALHRLPVIFACENNLYSCYTHIQERQPERSLLDLAKGHALKAHSIDGNNVFALNEGLVPIVNEVKNGGGPAFIEMKTYRTLEHCGPANDDSLGYRHNEEIKFWNEHDALSIARTSLKASELDEKRWQKEIAQEIADAFTFAIDSPYPDKKELGAYVYAK